MGMPSHKLLVQRLAGINIYRTAFSKAFPQQAVININNVARAIASSERT